MENSVSKETVTVKTQENQAAKSVNFKFDTIDETCDKKLDDDDSSLSFVETMSSLDCVSQNEEYYSAKDFNIGNTDDEIKEKKTNENKKNDLCSENGGITHESTSIETAKNDSVNNIVSSENIVNETTTKNYSSKDNGINRMKDIGSVNEKMNETTKKNRLSSNKEPQRNEYCYTLSLDKEEFQIKDLNLDNLILGLKTDKDPFERPKNMASNDIESKVDSKNIEYTTQLENRLNETTKKRNTSNEKLGEYTKKSNLTNDSTRNDDSANEKLTESTKKDDSTNDKLTEPIKKDDSTNDKLTESTKKDDSTNDKLTELTKKDGYANDKLTEATNDNISEKDCHILDSHLSTLTRNKKTNETIKGTEKARDTKEIERETNTNNETKISIIKKERNPPSMADVGDLKKEQNGKSFIKWNPFSTDNPKTLLPTIIENNNDIWMNTEINEETLPTAPKRKLSNKDSRDIWLDGLLQSSDVMNGKLGSVTPNINKSQQNLETKLDMGRLPGSDETPHKTLQKNVKIQGNDFGKLQTNDKTLDLEDVTQQMNDKTLKSNDKMQRKRSKMQDNNDTTQQKNDKTSDKNDEILQKNYKYKTGETQQNCSKTQEIVNKKHHKDKINQLDEKTQQNNIAQEITNTTQQKLKDKPIKELHIKELSNNDLKEKNCSNTLNNIEPKQENSEFSQIKEELINPKRKTPKDRSHYQRASSDDHNFKTMDNNSFRTKDQIRSDKYSLIKISKSDNKLNIKQLKSNDQIDQINEKFFRSKSNSNISDSKNYEQIESDIRISKSFEAINNESLSVASITTSVINEQFVVGETLDGIEHDSLDSHSYLSDSNNSIDKLGDTGKKDVLKDEYDRAIEKSQKYKYNDEIKNVNETVPFSNKIQTCGKCSDNLTRIIYRDNELVLKNSDDRFKKDKYEFKSDKLDEYYEATPRGSEQLDDKPTLTEISVEKRSSLFRKMSTLTLNGDKDGGSGNNKRLIKESTRCKFDWKRLLAQILAVSAKNTLALNFGMSIGFQTIAIPALQKPDSDLHLDLEQISLYGSLFFTVIPIGCLLSGPTIHGWGRKPAMLIFCLPLFVAWWVYYFAMSPPVLYLAILLMGLVNGLLEAPILTYVAEITEARWRGMLASSSIVAALFGVFLQLLFGTIMNWRTAAAVNSAFPILSFLCICFVPESPHWLASKNRVTDVEKSLMWLRGWTDRESVASEVDELIAVHNQPRVAKTPLSWKAYRSRTFIEPFLIVIGAFAIGHFSGMATVQTYSVMIFDSFGVNGLKWTAGMGATQVLGALTCVVALPILGKRPISVLSMIGVGVGMIGAATAQGTLAASSLLLANFCTNACSRVVPWVLIGEVFTNEMRAVASGLSSSICYLMGFILSYTYLRLEATITLKVLLGIYGGVGLLGAIGYYFFLPETEGKSLSEVQEYFASRKSNGKGIENLAFEKDKP